MSIIASRLLRNTRDAAAPVSHELTVYMYFCVVLSLLCFVSDGVFRPLVCEDIQADVEDGQLQFFYILAFVLQGDKSLAKLLLLIVYSFDSFPDHRRNRL